jgi:hypothetical protein
MNFVHRPENNHLFSIPEMDKALEPSDSECYIPLSEHIRLNPDFVTQTMEFYEINL